ncbi:TetR/AcrR family transcriptional regulator [Streptomyces carpaticus]|uniref:DNA-binding transcriptional regulator, AcrR family n=2 Tax=Streptomyces TaxID=1883 RepID=A0A1I6S300_9ACTN|nr:MULTISPECIES: TetR/AcrR family transcriptional regulator [Streptomyces]MCK1813593.1 TetR/AcrR family transcriptional regulator [Streptomyces sp. XM4011]QKV68169.1 TetR/AcrR family transcriptional regulator [Streptomyces harbinensis]UWM48486.1 TetR/AcrR family transcriptional regulator [Streptomyces carpaticus]SFS71286.1 DNA-binding transcriptional regulator, AcrR family [Streptomyces harbinensis]
MLSTPTGAPQPRPGRPRDVRIDEAVPTAVLELLNEGGYARLTMEAVASRAGTSKPALRRRWRSRPHLVVDALATVVGTQPTPDTGCTHCDLIAGINTLTQAFTTDLGRRALPALVADLADDPELESAFLDRFFHPRRATTAEALRRGIARGDIRPDADIDLLLDMLAATTYYRVLFHHLPLTPDLAEQVVRTVLSGVATAQWRAAHRS